MSAFSSRFISTFLHQHSFRLPSSIRVAIFSTRSRCAQYQNGHPFFSPSLVRQYSKVTGYPNVSRVRPAPYLRTAGITDPVARSVQASGKPMLLYKEPDRRLYMLGVYGLASGCIAAGLYTWQLRYEFIQKIEGLAFFVGPTYIVVGMIFMAVGTYIFTAPVMRCTSLELIPNVRGPVQLRLRSRLVPFSKEKEIVCNIGSATLSQKILPVVAELREARRARTQSLTDDLKGVSVMRSTWVLMMRFIDQKWTSFFLRFKFAVLRFGIVNINVDGEGKYKLDCEGFMLEDGKAIDRLISEE